MTCLASRTRRNARVYVHTTTAMHDMSTLPPPPPPAVAARHPLPPFRGPPLCGVFFSKLYSVRVGEGEEHAVPQTAEGGVKGSEASPKVSRDKKRSRRTTGAR